MKIERRITPNRFETNSRARKLRNSSSVKLGTFPSYSPSLSFFLSFPLSPSLYFLLLFPYVACFQGRVHQLPLFLFSIRDCPSPFSFFFFFVRQFRYSPCPPPSLPSPYPLLLALRPRAPSLVDALFSSANERRESASSRICVLSLCPRSFGSIPAGNVNTLSTAAKLLLATVVSPRTVLRYRNLYKYAWNINRDYRIWNSLDNISYY